MTSFMLVGAHVLSQRTCSARGEQIQPFTRPYELTKCRRYTTSPTRSPSTTCAGGLRVCINLWHRSYSTSLLIHIARRTQEKLHGRPYHLHCRVQGEFQSRFLITVSPRTSVRPTHIRAPHRPTYRNIVPCLRSASVSLCILGSHRQSQQVHCVHRRHPTTSRTSVHYSLRLHLWYLSLRAQTHHPCRLPG